MKSKHIQYASVFNVESISFLYLLWYNNQLAETHHSFIMQSLFFRTVLFKHTIGLSTVLLSVLGIQLVTDRLLLENKLDPSCDVAASTLKEAYSHFKMLVMATYVCEQHRHIICLITQRMYRNDMYKPLNLNSCNICISLTGLCSIMETLFLCSIMLKSCRRSGAIFLSLWYSGLLSSTRSKYRSLWGAVVGGGAVTTPAPDSPFILAWPPVEEGEWLSFGL